MRSSGKWIRRGLVRLIRVLLSHSSRLSFGGTGRQFGSRKWSPWRVDAGARRHYESQAQWSVGGRVAVLAALLFLATGVLVSLKLELLLFNFIDSYVCFYLNHEVYKPTSLSSAKVPLIPTSQLVIRAVYLDPRPRNGFINVSVFLVEASKDLLARMDVSLVACGTSSGISTTVTVRETLNSQWPHMTEPQLTHDVAMIDCFGLPYTRSGSRAFLWYQHEGERQLYRVESEKPYFIPHPKQTHNEDDLKIVVCMAIVRDFPPYMREFLRYYKHLGVDHVYMTGEDSFFRNGILEGDEFVKKALTEGFISFSFWHQWLNSDQMFYHSQILAHEDCIYRFQGTYDYALLVDSDDHFIPLVPQKKSLDFYAKQYCRFGACVFPWLEYYPDCGQHWERLGSYGNVTNTLSSLTHERRVKAGKSMHRISAVLDAGTHKPQKLLNGYWHTKVPPKIAYIAHLRKNREPPHGLQSC